MSAFVYPAGAALNLLNIGVRFNPETAFRHAILPIYKGSLEQ